MKIRIYFILFILLLPLLCLRDFTPNNELKYLSIADEAVENGHIFALTNHGIPYADKPPLYFWSIMLEKLLFGSYSMFFTVLLSLLPAFFILYIMDKWCRPFLSSKPRSSAGLMLFTTGLFIGSAIVLRMDMLMCMFIVLALYTFYKIYEGEHRKRDKFLLPVYIFLALFSKGPIGLIIPLISIFVFLCIKKEWRNFGRYFGGPQWLILAGLSFLWFTAVYIEGGKAYLHNLLFNQTVNRAINSFNHQEPFYYYLESIWYSLAPWSLFYIWMLFTGIRKKLIKTDIERFFLVIIAVTFIVLSIFSSKLSIYMLPAFPFFTYLSVLILPRIKEKSIYFSIIIPAVILLSALPAFYLLRNQAGMHLPFVLYPATLILSVSALATLVFLYRKNLYHAVNTLTIGILLAVFTGSFALPNLNPYIGFKEISKKALELAKHHGINEFYFYKFRSGENMDVYLGDDIKKAAHDSICYLADKKDFILFLRNKDLQKIPDIQKAVQSKSAYKIGGYSIIVFKQKLPESKLLK